MRLLSFLPALALVCLAASAPLAQADYDPLGSGATRLTLDRGFLGLLKQNGVKLSAVAPARLKGAVVTFPVSGGKFDPTNGRGTVEHEGALLLRAGDRKLPLKALQLKTTQRRSPFSVKAGGGQLKLASAAKLTVSREGFGERVEVSSLTLSAKLAIKLGKKLRLRGVFEEGQPLGRALTRVQPETIAVLGKGKASLVLDPRFAARLSSLFVAVNPIFPAEHPGAEFTLPIFGGAIAPDGSIGTLETEGALELLQLGGGQLFWADGWLDLGAGVGSAEVNVQPSPPYAGKQGRVGVFDLNRNAALASSNPLARMISVAGVPLTLQAGTAASMNQAFVSGREVFLAGEAFGTVSFAAQGQ